MSPSILDDLLAGRFVADQYLGLVVLGLACLGAVFAFGVWLHVKDTKDDARGRKLIRLYPSDFLRESHGMSTKEKVEFLEYLADHDESRGRQ